ncbi:MAG: hypothetical protein CDV28_12624 [Candidatus Electronema aureum]|uniref:Uncharacterized protein n=1 Tax=Candidatus Electronema aureum TaxID=2005002 RepID=A0A521G0B3_9BACT|nr:MAG: hypothetical protein CDV28_12624 [Candidatus Electronema aureum]
MTEVNLIRDAIIAALPAETSNYGEVPKTGHLYVPPAHLKALRLESCLVVGTRGVGKSFWTAALGSESIRAALGQSVSALKTARVYISFSGVDRIEDYPNADIFSRFSEQEKSFYDLWRCVILRWLAKEILNQQIPNDRWEDTADWLKSNPEDAARIVQQSSQKLNDDNQHGLFLFDALDRTSQNWKTMDNIVRDLLRTALWLKSYPKLSAKIFLREDQFERTVTDFPDASKLLATKAELNWAQHDLHGLLWQMLINAPDKHGECLRAVYQRVTGAAEVEMNSGWWLAEEIKRENTIQRNLFKALAGPWMGKDRRRGVPYVWSVSHLADGRGRTSPRSFLAAIRQAAEDSQERYHDYSLALHYESIKRGIQKASDIRVSEMAEDYPWVRTFLEPLKGLTVPCEFDLVLERWISSFPSGPESAHGSGLPPQHAARGWEGVREDLLRLGLFEAKKDGRIDMPDLYRVGFGLGRRGGVKPKS